MNFKLYLISDRKLFNTEEDFLKALQDALSSGIKAFQLREKDLTAKEFYYLAKKVRDITRKYNALLFINDRIDIALAVEADGVHLPQKGIPCHIVRKLWGNRFIIGVSTHSIEEAKEASEWADFITFSPIFYTPSKGKPQGIQKLMEIKNIVRCKVFGLGGINMTNIQEVIPYCDGVAMIRGVLGQRNLKNVIPKYKEMLGENL